LTNDIQGQLQIQFVVCQGLTPYPLIYFSVLIILFDTSSFYYLLILPLLIMWLFLRVTAMTINACNSCKVMSRIFPVDVVLKQYRDLNLELYILMACNTCILGIYIRNRLTYKKDYQKNKSHF
jgi:hypothetical protein